MTQEYIHRPHATEKDYDRAFQGLEFPVAIHQVIRRAQDTGGIDHEVNDMLHRLPRDQYESESQLKGDLRMVYVADGFAEDTIPV